MKRNKEKTKTAEIHTMTASVTADDIPRLRLNAQQLEVPRFDDPHDVVEWMGMIQAQDYRAMRWAVAMRTVNPSAKAFKRAYDEGRIIRTHLFRCTWQLVAAEDLHSMLALCADKNRRTINGYLSAYGRSVSEREYAEFNRLIKEILHGHVSMRKDELTAALSERGFNEDAHTFSVYLRRAETDGIVCSGHLDARQNTYALIASRVPPPTGGIPTREEITGTVARKYFRSHSPATLRDFVWWTGLSVKECQGGIDAIATELTAHIIDGDTYYLHNDAGIVTPHHASASPHTHRHTSRTLLLPPYDEYLIGYKSRHHVLEDTFRSRAFSNNGIFRHVIVSDGHIAGNWHPRTNSPDFFSEEYSTDTADARAAYSMFEKN